MGAGGPTVNSETGQERARAGGEPSLWWRSPREGTNLRYLTVVCKVGTIVGDDYYGVRFKYMGT